MNEVIESLIKPKKKAFLVFGAIAKDTKAIAKQIQAQKEFETSGLFEHISEGDAVSAFIDMNNFHPLCEREWFAPIKNNAIIYLLEKTEELMNDRRVTGIIIDGTFAVNKEVRKSYSEILKEQGYELEIVPVHSNMMSIIFYGYSTGLKISTLYSLWKQMNEQFSRIYEPNPELPDAVIVCGSIREPMLLEIIESLSGNNLILVIDSERKKEYAFKLDKTFVGISKRDQFWSKIAYHYNVKLVIDDDANSVFEWQKINVPVISLTSQFSLEKPI